MTAGRPSKYDPEFCEQARRLCLLGATDQQLADFFMVDPDTIYEWQRVHPKFSESIRAGKVVADAEIAASLFQRAKGYSHDAVKIFMPQGAEKPVYAPYVEHYPPDTAAASLWLRNRQSALWRDKLDTTTQALGKDGQPIDPVVPVLQVTIAGAKPNP